MALKEESSAHIEKALAESTQFPLSHAEQEHAATTTVQDWTPEEEKKLVWKIDRRVFPMLCTIYAFSLLDRANISAAFIAGLDEDVGLAQGSRYSVALLVFFIGYALFELPSNYVIRRIGARWWLSFLAVGFGAVVLGMGFIHSWQSLVVLRTFLGFFEAGLYPGAVYIIASFYKQYETGKRISFFYMSALFASGFGPILAYVFSLIRHGDGIYRQGWRWIFIIEGSLTIVVGLISPLFIAEFPEKASFLDDREKHIAQARLHTNQPAQKFKHPTVKESFKMLMDWKILVFSFQYFVAAVSVYALAYFQPIILRSGMGYSYALAQILSSPPYVGAMIFSLTTAWLSDKIRMRWPIMCSACLVAVTGLLIVLYAKPPGVRYFGLFLAVCGCQANAPASLSYGQNQTAQLGKRGVVAAAMISVGAIGGICGSTIFRSQDAPQYLPGMWTTICLQLAVCVVTFATSMHLKRLNSLADEGIRPALEGVEGFRYAP
ncbi:hypothetical protein H2200_006569 [Cladophialophora chaetospira]|uniref:Major facilitator superfamily (MFS) profile domain-containing protein n=1 Tax=Cladophialophora chaetospira TaxID=386627 RepID=A0AA38X8G3_9EURO|nr:hypothetical protein H2200_006569 [Cladophialophora chaetospira]